MPFKFNLHRYSKDDQESADVSDTVSGDGAGLGRGGAQSVLTLWLDVLVLRSSAHRTFAFVTTSEE